MRMFFVYQYRSLHLINEIFYYVTVNFPCFIPIDKRAHTFTAATASLLNIPSPKILSFERR